ncbi:MAG: hypothetical protein R2854_05670 [Caldilineaceae bacterium]
MQHQPLVLAHHPAVIAIGRRLPHEFVVRLHRGRGRVSRHAAPGQQTETEGGVGQTRDVADARQAARPTGEGFGLFAQFGRRHLTQIQRVDELEEVDCARRVVGLLRQAVEGELRLLHHAHRGTVGLLRPEAARPHIGTCAHGEKLFAPGEAEHGFVAFQQREVKR